MINRFVIIAGNIGAGKSSLTAMLSRELGWQAMFEPAEANPYLASFYENPQQWGFHSQMFFLLCRFRSYGPLLTQEKSIVQDRSIYEDGDIFARNLYQKGYISERDWFLYRGFYEKLTDLLPSPDLIIYLRASVSILVDRILQRDRPDERTIAQSYLTELNTFYEEWVKSFSICPVLTIETDNLDFVNRREHFEFIKAEVLNSLEMM
jgi:deoxyadenosine/deoxycytidine kinase